MGITISLIVLSLLVFFHELGHYSVAKFFGVHVEVFSIGFGKKLFTFRAFNTQWTIALIPLGGYVKMKGQNDLDPASISNDDDSYNSKTPLQRIAILLAGPVANFILAFFLYLAIAFGSPQVLAPVIGDVVKDSPAQTAGLQSKDKIISINSKKIQTWEEMSKLITASKGVITLQIERGAYIETLHVEPKMRESKNMYGETIHRKMVGISSAGELTRLNLSFFESFEYAYHETYRASNLIFEGLQKLITGVVPVKELGGVVSIVKITSDASASGWMALFFFAALISVNLGILNLLPIPALDGGHIMFNLYELITKQIPSEAVLVKLTVAGWVVLLGLMSLGLYNDINRLMG
ncbi:MAG: RIP metalloprotease RseP [Campylobacterota bacterium]|nr:RIP metalloprotease RseP [Campylobacterota bacterium]